MLSRPLKKVLGSDMIDLGRSFTVPPRILYL